MTAEAADPSTIEQIANGVLGQSAWGVSIGVGSNLTLEFGRPRITGAKKAHGEWHLWIMSAVWRLQSGNEVLAGSEDERPKLLAAAQALEGKKVTSVEVVPPANDVTLGFGDLLVRVFAITSESYEHWMLYTPDSKVLVVGPGTQWRYQSASEPLA